MQTSINPPKIDLIVLAIKGKILELHLTRLNGQKLPPSSKIKHPILCYLCFVLCPLSCILYSLFFCPQFSAFYVLDPLSSAVCSLSSAFAAALCSVPTAPSPLLIVRRPLFSSFFPLSTVLYSVLCFLPSILYLLCFVLDAMLN